jgi:hypothetical protein
MRPVPLETDAPVEPDHEAKLRVPHRVPHRGRLRHATVYVLILAALSAPGVIPFDRIHPTILGVPFAIAWVFGCTALGGLLLWVLELREPE